MTCFVRNFPEVYALGLYRQIEETEYLTEKQDLFLKPFKNVVPTLIHDNTIESMVKHTFSYTAIKNSSHGFEEESINIYDASNNACFRIILGERGDTRPPRVHKYTYEPLRGWTFPATDPQQDFVEVFKFMFAYAAKYPKK